MSEKVTPSLAYYGRNMILIPFILSAVVIGGLAMTPPALLSEYGVLEWLPLSNLLLMGFWYAGLRVKTYPFRLSVHVLRTIVLPFFYGLSMLCLNLVLTRGLEVSSDLGDLMLIVDILNLPIVWLLIRDHIRYCLDTPLILRLIGLIFLPTTVLGSQVLPFVLLPIALMLLVFMLAMPYGKYIRLFIYPPPIKPAADMTERSGG